MKKPLISLTAKDFLTGVNELGAHGFQGGVFMKADGVTPLYEAGKAQSTLNGLLMAGAAATTVGGSTPNGNFLCSKSVDLGSSRRAWFGTSSGHIFYVLTDAASLNLTGDGLHDAHTVTSGYPVLAIEAFGPAGGTKKMYYFTIVAVGEWTGSAFADAATLSSGSATLNTAYVRPVHRYFDNLLYGNGYGAVGSLYDDGANGVANNATALDVPLTTIPTAISDDGVYAVIAVTDNISCDTDGLSDTRILFWDGSAGSWNREYSISDPFIYAIKRTPVGVFAFGQTGIWQLSFSSVPKKILSHSPGIYAITGYNTLLYGAGAASFFSDAVIWGGSSGSNYAVKSLGKLDSSASSAYLHPFLSTASKHITSVDGQLLKGYVFVGDDTPQLKAYPFSTTNSPQTTVSAQTIYYPLPERMQIDHIDVVFGEALVSGDAFNIETKLGEDKSAVTFDSASYASDGATYRKVMTPKSGPMPIADSQISFVFNWTGGAVKIKRVDIYGTPTPAY
jgi:hypothetical protein